MKLTPRQRDFLDKLLDLYRELRRPIHYTEIAEKLGVNKFSAYDMLRVLERKGLAASEYVLAGRGAGPGRSMIVFYPTVQGMQQARGEIRLGEEWLQFRERLLERLREARQTNYRELLNELLARLPERKAPLEYCTEMIAALLLNLNAMRERVGQLNPLRILTEMTTGGEVGLGALAGFSLGSTLDEDLPLTERLVSYTRRYQEYLRELSETSKNALSDFLRDAISIFSENSEEE